MKPLFIVISLCDYNMLSYAIDSGMCVDCVSLDFSKAFDRLRHDHLIQKLKEVDISGHLLKWLIDYLSHRSQFVNVNCHLSSKNKSEGV